MALCNGNDIFPKTSTSQFLVKRQFSSFLTLDTNTDPIIHFKKPNQYAMEWVDDWLNYKLNMNWNI